MKVYYFEVSWRLSKTIYFIGKKLYSFRRLSRLAVTVYLPRWFFVQFFISTRLATPSATKFEILTVIVFPLIIIEHFCVKLTLDEQIFTFKSTAKVCFLYRFLPFIFFSFSSLLRINLVR